MRRGFRVPWVRGLVLVGVLLGVLVIPGSSSASPLNFCTEQLAPEPESVGSGITSILQSPQREDHENDGGLTAGVEHYQAYGIAGTQWHAIVTEDCMHPNRVSPRNEMASAIWDTTRLVANGVIFVYQLAASDVLLTGISDLVTDLVVMLREGIYRPLIPTVFILGAIWLGWVGLIKKRATLTVEGAVWMVFATTVSIWMTTAPAQVMGASTWITNSGTALIHDTFSSANDSGTFTCPAPGVTVPFQGGENPEYYGEEGPEDLPSGENDGSSGETSEPSEEPSDEPSDGSSDGPRWPGDPVEEESDPPTSGPIDPVPGDEPTEMESPPPLGDLSLTPQNMELSSSTTETHTSSEAMWTNSQMLYDALVCTPWTMGIFGNEDGASAAASQYAEQTIRAQSISLPERNGYMGTDRLTLPEYEAITERKEEEYRAISEQVHHHYPELWGAWSGTDDSHRLSTAIVAFVGVILAGLLVTIMSVAIVVLKVVFLLMLIICPIVCLVGIHPGVGRVIFRNYFEMLGGVLLKQLFILLFLMVFLIIYGWIIRSGFHWSVQIFLLFVTYCAVFYWRKQVAQALASMNTGAVGRMFQKVADDKTLRRASNIVPGVAAYQADRKIREKFSPLIGQVLGAAVGGPMGAQVGQQLGEKNSARLRGDHKKKPQDAPPMPQQSPGAEGSRWQATDVTPAPSRQHGGSGAAPPLSPRTGGTGGTSGGPGPAPSAPGGGLPPGGGAPSGGSSGKRPAGGLPPGGPPGGGSQGGSGRPSGGAPPLPASGTGRGSTVPQRGSESAQPRRQPTPPRTGEYTEDPKPKPRGEDPSGYQRPVIIGNMKIYRPLQRNRNMDDKA